MDRLFGRQAFHVAYAIAVSHLLNLWNCEATKVSLRLSFQLWQLWSNKCREVNCSWHINSILTSGKDFTTVFLVLLCAKLWKQLRERKRRNDVLQSYTQPVTPDLSKTSSCDLNQCRLCNSLSGRLDLENLLFIHNSQSFSLSRSSLTTTKSVTGVTKRQTHVLHNIVKQSNATIEPNSF